MPAPYCSLLDTSRGACVSTAETGGASALPNDDTGVKPPYACDPGGMLSERPLEGFLSRAVLIGGGFARLTAAPSNEGAAALVGV